MIAASGTPWEHGRFDARRGPSRVLFGQMYEDVEIERAVFEPGSRIFCIASAGCTAMALAPDHQVVAVDINPEQLAYAARRLAGGHAMAGTAERMMAFGRWFAPMVGWPRARVMEFLQLEDADEQVDYWERHLDTLRFRTAIDTLLSLATLRALYASPFLGFLPQHLGAVMRQRLVRGFSRHANRNNPYARALLLGELPHAPAPPEALKIELVQADAAEFLERAPLASFSGFTLSNILDGADVFYKRRLLVAVKRAATPDAVMVLRSFAEPSENDAICNRAADDRSLIWGMVAVLPVSRINRGDSS